MTADLVAFLKGALDEDQRTAEAATPGPWRAVEMYSDVLYVEAESRNIANESSIGDIATPDAVHIAAWDPPRVLADIAAKRALIDHEDMWGEDSSYVLLILAQAYRDRPGFDPSWTS